MSEAEAPVNVGELLNKLLHVKKTASGWTADCPCEGHSTPGGHLSVTDAGDKALVSCFNVHSYEQICAALGYRSLSYNREGHRAEVPRRIVKTYPYTDEQGHLLYETVRYDPKDFRQRRPDGKGGWLWNLESTRRVLYKLPHVLSAIARHEPIILCEGEKDADTVYERTGIVATTSPMGAGKWNGHDYEDALDRAYVVICGDTDKPGLAHVDQVARSLHGTAATVKILSLPSSVKDVTEWFEAEGTPDQFRSMIEQARVYVPEGLPIISVTDRHLREVTSDALEALYHANDPPLVFRRSGVLTRVALDERGRPQAEALSEAALRGRMARVANFVRINPKGSMVPVPPPLDVTRDVASLSDLAFFPKLTGITESPVLRNDGTILAEPGYDSATGLFYQPVSGFVLPPVPSSPTSSDIAEAAALLQEVFYDFPFDGEASRAGAIAALISSVLRPAIDGPTPLAVVDKPQPGTGASLIANVISIAASGHMAAMMGLPPSDEEWEKKLGGILMAGRTMCVIDNIETKLYSETLARYLTSPNVSVRPLGQSTNLVLPNSLIFIATGNNVRLGGDLPRRCYWVRLDAKDARPWMRNVDYRHKDLLEWVTASRGRILGAIFTVTRAWFNAGRPVPRDLPILGGFENFCRMIGGTLSCAGIGGFLANVMDLYERMDLDTPQWEGFLEAWREVIGEGPITVANLIARINQSEELAAALPDAIATRDSRDYSRRVGNALAKRNDMRLPNGMMVTKAGTYKHAVSWKVVSYQDTGTDLTHQKQLVLGSDGEIGELDFLRSRRSPEQDVYIEGAITNSANSPPGSKPGELAHGDPGDSPAGPCPNCQTEDEWGFTPDGLSYYCTRCGYVYPPPGREVSQ